MKQKLILKMISIFGTQEISDGTVERFLTEIKRDKVT